MSFEQIDSQSSDTNSADLDEPRFRRFLPSELGFFTVRHANRMAKLCSEDGLIGYHWYTYGYENDENNLALGLDAERNKIKEACDERKIELYNTITDSRASPFIRRIINSAVEEMITIRAQSGLRYIDENGEIDLTVEAIAHQKETGQYILANESLLNLLEYYVDQQAPGEYTETSVSAAYKTKYKERIHELVRLSILPAVALTRLSIIDTTQITYDDRPQNDAIVLDGYHSKDFGAVITALAANTAIEERTVFHELTHAITDISDEVAESNLEIVGLRASSDSKRELKRIFNEGMTEIIAEALCDKTEAEDEGIYGAERNLIFALCEYSDGQLTIRDFVETLFTDESSRESENMSAMKSDTKNVSWLVQRIRSIYGIQLLKDIATHDQYAIRGSNGICQITLRLFETYDPEVAEKPNWITPNGKLLGSLFGDEKRADIEKGMPTKRNALRALTL